MGKKTCGRCGNIKPLSCFARDNRRKDGLQLSCKECSSRMTMIYRKLKPFNPGVCSIDGKRGKITPHHPDYNKTWQVVWACPSCHSRLNIGMTFDRALMQDYSDKIKLNTTKYSY